MNRNMYGGLFGDLPAAKNDAKKSDEATPSESKVNPAVPPDVSSTNRPSKSPVVAPDPIIPSVKPAPKKVTVLQMIPRSSKLVPTHTLRPRQQPIRKQPIADPVKPLVSEQPIASHSTEIQTTKDLKVISTTDTIGNDSCNENKASLHFSYPPMAVTADAAVPQPVTDPYDPMVPNDVLAYWDRQAAVAQQERWAQERAQLWRDQEAVRRQLEQERQSLLQQGKVEELVERGRGRGGLSNVPAWLVAQQKQQQAQRDEPP
jgi:hypothetical protein